jgi:type II secretory pathway pseudopilin PulG
MVILIIAAIAIPSLLHAKMRANEAAALASVKTIQSAEVLYANTYPEVGYAGSLANLGSHGSTCERPTSTAACIIMDDSLTSGIKSGYLFDIVGDGNKPTVAYTVNASPESSASGRCSVTADQGGNITFTAPSTEPTPGRSLGAGAGGSGCAL